MKKKKENKNRQYLYNIFLFIVSLGVIITTLFILWIASFKIPDFNSFDERITSGSTKIYDRTGEILLYDIHQDVKRTNIDFEEMGDNIKMATIAIEDSEFYNHKGVRITSTVRAVFSNIFGIGIGGGGSTITQQLVKNTFLTQKVSIARKIKEWVLAYKIDSSLSKDKILELYLNDAPYGGTIYGIEEASREYLDKRPSELTINEAAYLASIPQSPTYLSPYRENNQRLEERKNLVLFRMQDLGMITEEEYGAAKAESINFEKPDTTGIKAPHFVFFIKDYLEKRYGQERILQGGLKVTTTLDYDLQQKAEEIAEEEALKNEESYDGSNISMVAIDPQNGNILTMVGSRNYFDENIDGNYNVATALRQPGSSFKPFIYATAFEQGFTPSTVLFDLPTEFNSSCSPYGKAQNGYSQENCYMPQNYDGKNLGPMTLRSALAQSRNVPAVKLFYLTGLQNSLRTAENLGISTLTDVNRYGLTLVIGGGEVTLLDMTSAYSVLANQGIKNPYTGILKIEDENGKVLEKFEKKETEVLSKNAALTLTDVLSDNQARVPTFGSRSSLYIDGYDVAAKTGTTNSNKDAWLIGYSPNISIGVWTGNNDNTPMKKGGSTVAGPAWNKLMSYALTNKEKEFFEEPTEENTNKPVLKGSWLGNEVYEIDNISGKLATEYTPEETKEEKVITNVHSILHWIKKTDPTGSVPTEPWKDSQYSNWETVVQDWWMKNQWKYQINSALNKPTEYDDVHTPQSAPFVTIISPNKNIEYIEDSWIPLQISSQGVYPIRKIDIFINNTFIESTNSPYNYYIKLNEVENIQRINSIKLISYDTVYNKSETETEFMVK